MTNSLGRSDDFPRNLYYVIYTMKGNKFGRQKDQRNSIPNRREIRAKALKGDKIKSLGCSGNVEPVCAAGHMWTQEKLR